MNIKLLGFVITVVTIFSVCSSLSAQRFEVGRLGIEGVALSKDVGLLSQFDHTSSFQWHTPLRVWYAQPIGEKELFFEGSVGLHDRVYKVDSEVGSERLRLRGAEFAAGLGWTLLNGKYESTDRLQVSLLGVARVGRAKGVASEEGFDDLGTMLVGYIYEYDDRVTEVGGILKVRFSANLSDRISFTFTPRVMLTSKRSKAGDDGPRAITKTFGGKPIFDQEILCVGVAYRL